MHELVEHSDVTVSGTARMENFLLRYRVAYPDPVLTLTRDGATRLGYDTQVWTGLYISLSPAQQKVARPVGLTASPCSAFLAPFPGQREVAAALKI